MAKRKIQRNSIEKRGSNPKSRSNLIPFQKNDERINRKGRPKNFDEVRALFKDIASEPLGESGLTRIEAMGLKLSSSRNGNDNRLFLEYGFGKVKEQVEQSGELTVRVIRDDGNSNQTPAPTPGATADQE